MKITEVAEECRTGAFRLWGPLSGYKNDFDHGQAIVFDQCANMLEETVHEIREELSRVRTDAKNGELSGPIRANAEAVAVMLEWVIEE